MVASTDTLGVFTDGSASVGWWHGGGAIHLHTFLKKVCFETSIQAAAAVPGFKSGSGPDCLSGR